MQNNLFGQYSHNDTLLHKLDPRIKILLVVFISVFLFFTKSYFSFILISFFIISLIIISKIKLINILRNVRSFLFFFIFIFLMYFLFSKSKLTEGIITIWRFILLIIIASILTFSTTTNQLVYAIEKLFTPLKLMKISPRNLALMTSITIRFIPLLFLETNRIKDALKSRGANLKRIRYILIFISSLLRKTFNKASNLADAIESRCYRDYGYSHFKESKICMRDYVSVLVVIIFGGILLWMKI